MSNHFNPRVCVCVSGQICVPVSTFLLQFPPCDDINLAEGKHLLLNYSYHLIQSDTNTFSSPCNRKLNDKWADRKMGYVGNLEKVDKKRPF